MTLSKLFYFQGILFEKIYLFFLSNIQSKKKVFSFFKTILSRCLKYILFLAKKLLKTQRTKSRFFCGKKNIFKHRFSGRHTFKNKMTYLVSYKFVHVNFECFRIQILKNLTQTFFLFPSLSFTFYNYFSSLPPVPAIVY